MAGRPDAPNLVGHSLDKSIVEQFKQRAQRLGQTGVRDGDNLLDIANNNCWVRLSSFVSVAATGIADIKAGTGNELAVQAGTYLAQTWALKPEQRKKQGGLKYGVNSLVGAYGSGGKGELGYRPMPGIKSVSVESQPPLGALRSATVAIKAWNLNQLSMIDILYFRLGFSMLLEWGHNVFTDNTGTLITNPLPLDIFSKNSTLDTKEEVLRALEKKRKEYSYNYDGMLGIVTNYEWTQAQDGSYDCTLRLTGIGSIIESLKINTQDATPGSPAPPDTTSTQTAVADESSLSSFLSRIQSAYASNLATDTFWNSLYSSGLDLLNNPTDDFEYGYNTKYMSQGGTGGANIPKANLTNIKAWAKLSIIQVQPNGAPNAVTTARFITLGGLLAYINNSCLIYDKSKAKSKPAIYIDFNQETNFCLRIPQQFSVDPGVCLVDVGASDTDYNELFTIKGIDLSKITSPSSPINGKLQPTLTGTGVSYIDSTSTYRGKFMNIFVNVDCIKATLEENTDSDKNVFLSKFLSALMTKIQTALGNINVFQVGYDETANTVIIYDAQLVDMDNRTDPIPTLPVFGLQSIVRDFNLKTEASSKLGSMLAITARAGARNTGTNKDSSAFTVLNQSLSDRLFKDVSTSPNTTPPTTQPTGSTTGVEDLANTFNAQIGSLYEITTPNIVYYSPSIEAIKNYYIDAMLQIKGKNNSTSGKIDSVTATGILPLALNMTVDGIGGIPLYQAFTLPPNRIPAQYLKNGKPRIAFTIAGLNHTIENNQWTTAIRGLMINIPDDRRTYTPTYIPKQNLKGNPPPQSSSTKGVKVFSGTGLDPIKSLISTVEGNYNSYNYYKVDSKTKKKKLVSVIDGGTAIVTETIGQIQAKQKNKTYFAVGKFQAIPATLQTVVNYFKWPANKVFDIATQEQLGEYLLLKDRANLGNYIEGKNAGTEADLEHAVQSAGQVWASLPIIYSQNRSKIGEVVVGSSNITYYGGVGGNAGTSKYEIKDIVQNLIRSRIQYSTKKPAFIPPYYIA